MGKLKTRKVVTKRFKVTKTGKLLHGTQGARHLRRRKSKTRQRRQDQMRQVTNRAFERTIKNFLGI